MSKEADKLKDLLDKAKAADPNDEKAFEGILEEMEAVAEEGLKNMMTPPKRPEGAHLQLRAVPNDEKGTVSCEISCHGMTSDEVADAMVKFIENVNRDLIK